MVNIMKDFITKLKNFFKYGKFKTYENLYNFSIVYGDNTPLLFDYNPKTGQYEFID